MAARSPLGFGGGREDAGPKAPVLGKAERKTDPSPPLANGVTGFGITTKPRRIR